jgi:anti-sigma B factor antagonist
MNIAVDEARPGTAVLRLEGRLDLVSAAPLREAVVRVVAEGSPRVVVDLSGIAFMDSSGVGALVAGLKHARQAGGELRIAGAGEPVLTVLSLTTLDRVLRPYADVGAALQGL